MKGYYIENFGCRAAQADGSAIERQLADIGMQRVTDAESADLVVLNTCTVTAAADRDARAAIRRLQSKQPEAKILVTGCYAQRAPQELAGLKGVTWVVGNSHKHQIGNIVANSTIIEGDGFIPLSVFNQDSYGPSIHEKIYASEIFAHTELQPTPVFDGAARTRPNLKIQDGCDNRCSFCVIPFVRGQSRSLLVEDVLRQMEDFVRSGYREVVVSGINLGRWGRDFAPQERFVDLLALILERTSIQKLRLSSIEPMDWSTELISLMASSPRIAKHAHIPLQSGSDRILRKMHRKYRPWHYAEKVETIRKLMPDAAIGADVMVGFPGEDDELFEESRRFIESLPLTYLHIFTYSPRPGTAAASLPNQVALPLARARNRVLRDLAAAKNRAFRNRFLGRIVEAITLARSHQNGTEALTDNYLKLEIQNRQSPNQWVNARIQAVTVEGLSGDVVNR